MKLSEREGLACFVGANLQLCVVFCALGVYSPACEGVCYQQIAALIVVFPVGIVCWDKLSTGGLRRVQVQRSDPTGRDASGFGFHK